MAPYYGEFQFMGELIPQAGRLCPWHRVFIVSKRRRESQSRQKADSALHMAGLTLYKREGT